MLSRTFNFNLVLIVFYEIRYLIPTFWWKIKIRLLFFILLNITPVYFYHKKSQILIRIFFTFNVIFKILESSTVVTSNDAVPTNDKKNALLVRVLTINDLQFIISVLPSCPLMLYHIIKINGYTSLMI